MKSLATMWRADVRGRDSQFVIRRSGTWDQRLGTGRNRKRTFRITN
jgi:hypothetical protein